MLTQAEIAMMAERISKARDRDQRDAKAMLRQVGLDHGDDALRAVIEQMKLLSDIRCEEVSRVFEGLPPMPFAEALRIKRERNDPSARGWELQADGSFSKTTRCAPLHRRCRDRWRPCG